MCSGRRRRSGRAPTSARRRASHPGAHFGTTPDRQYLPWLVPEAIDEIEQFLTGVRPKPLVDRVLATIFFTDLVGSTERARELGDRAWSELLEQHYAQVRQELERFRGEEIDVAGDGFFALFDGPARAIRCALKVRNSLRELGLDMRAGVHHWRSRAFAWRKAARNSCAHRRAHS